MGYGYVGQHYKIDNLIETNSIELIRSQFANLLYGKDSLAKRWDEFRQKIKGIGPGIMSEILNKAFPNECILWNSKTKTGFTILEVPNTPKYDSAMDGKMYAYLSECGKKMLAFAKSKGYNNLEDMMDLNYFIWQEVQKDIDEPEAVDVVEVPKTKKESGFVHNDIRDKIKDIGECLGFKATTEVTVANGARVDAVWEVSIGNMGRIIYVFEVQTSGSIDSLILNLMKAKNNKAVRGIITMHREKAPRFVHNVPRFGEKAPRFGNLCEGGHFLSPFPPFAAPESTPIALLPRPPYSKL